MLSERCFVNAAKGTSWMHEMMDTLLKKCWGDAGPRRGRRRVGLDSIVVSSIDFYTKNFIGDILNAKF